MSSFMCEHTAEYVLVPAFIQLLTTQYEDVIPFYFWSGREGNNLSRECNKTDYFKLIAMFPRRPKLDSPNSRVVSAKINHTILATVPFYHRHEIPVFAGIPCVSSITDFTLRTQCVWFLLKDNCERDLFAGIDVKSRAIVEIEPTEALQGPLMPEEVLENISSRYFTWAEIVDTLQGIRQETKSINRSWWYFDSAYKPVYFALRE